MQAVKYSAVNTSVPSAAAFISEIYPPPILYKVSSHAFISAHREHRITRPRALWQKSLRMQNTAAVGHQRFGSASDAGREERDTPRRGEQRGEASRRVNFGWNNWTNWRSQRSELKVLYVMAVCGRAQREYKIKKIKLKGCWWRAGSRESRWRKESEAKQTHENKRGLIHSSK